MSKKLKPCPFCGAKAEKRIVSYYIYHKKNCIMKSFEKWDEKTVILILDKDTIKAWNTRLKGGMMDNKGMFKE